MSSNRGSSASKLPEPIYVDEVVNGAITTDGGLYCGVMPLDDAGMLIQQGRFIIRYAIPLIVPSTNALLLGLFLSERGQALTGREAWDYLQSRFQMHPRADVIGIDLTGKQQQVFVKSLDFGVPVRVFAYDDTKSSVPIIELSALYTDDLTFDTLPDLLKRYLPRA